MAESKRSPGGTGETGETGAAGGSGRKTLEMRVAELEDRLSKTYGGEERAWPACGACSRCCANNCVVSCVSCLPCIVVGCLCAFTGVAPPPTAQEGEGEAEMASQQAGSQKGMQACIAQQPINLMVSQCIIQLCVMQCIIQHCVMPCIIQQCINECGGGCLPGGSGTGSGGFGSLGR